MEKPVIIFGANGIGRTALEIFGSNDIIVYGFLDDDKAMHGRTMMDVQILGATTDDGFLKLIGHKCESFIATDDNAERKSVVEMLNSRRKVMPVNAIHKLAGISQSAYIEHGNFINMSAVIAPGARIGSHNIIHSGAIIDFESVIGSYVQLGSGCIIGAGATLHDEVFIGAGATVVPGISIGKGARVGAGSVVVGNIEENETVFGNPAKPVDV